MRETAALQDRLGPSLMCLPLLVGAALISVACGELQGGGDGNTADASAIRPDGGRAGDDAGTAGRVDARPGGEADAGGTGAVDITLTHSASQQIVAGHSVGCFASGTAHQDIRFFRFFDLSSFGVVGEFRVRQVQVGIETALAGSGGTQPADLRLYTLAGGPSLANLTPIASRDVAVPDQDVVVQSVDLAATIPADSVLAVEFHIPNGSAANHKLLVGTNSAGETDPTYAVSVDCMVTEISTLSSLGVSDVHWVLNVVGTYQP